MSIIKELPELIQAEVITKETAAKIQAYYDGKGSPLTNKLFIIFGILGAILVGLGVILILAHNWDQLSRFAKVFFAFLPLVTSQLICGYVLLRQNDSVSWRETGALLLFFAVGASVALISQIYHIPGNLSSFILTWIALALPIVYFMRSSVVSMFYIIGLTYLAVLEGYWFNSSLESFLLCLGLLTSILPYYYFLYKRNPNSNFMTFHNWLIPASAAIILGTIQHNMEEFLAIAYMSLFGLLYLVGDLGFFSKQKLRNNGFRVIGAIGTMIMLLGLSFDWFWDDIRKAIFPITEVVTAPEFWAAVILTIIAAILFAGYLKRREKGDFKPIAPVFILFIVAFLLGFVLPLTGVLINLSVFAIGLLTIREGIRYDHLVILNYGLITITALITCRFFDTDLNFVFRGLLFIFIGAGFFAANYFMLQKRKDNELS
jgi:uncharacterized membrane protein